MADLKAWWGHTEQGDERVVVARGASDAAKLVGVNPQNFPYLFGSTARNDLARGVYKLQDGRWVPA